MLQAQIRSVIFKQHAYYNIEIIQEINSYKIIYKKSDLFKELFNSMLFQ